RHARPGGTVRRGTARSCLGGRDARTAQAPGGVSRATRAHRRLHAVDHRVPARILVASLRAHPQEPAGAGADRRAARTGTEPAMEYLIVKWLHVLSSTFLFGTGVGSAFYLFAISLGRDTQAGSTITRYVVIADWIFTATTIVLRPLTGWYLMQLMGLTMDARWIAWSVALFALATACW